MKQFSLFLAAMFVLASSFLMKSDAVKDAFKVSTTDSQVLWFAKKVTGAHNGSVALKSGTIEFQKQTLVGGQFVIDMTSIKVLDLEADSKPNKNLTGHLKSPDFFDVEKHTTAELKIKKATKTGQKSVFGNGDEYKVSATLTIKGISQDIEFFANVSVSGKTAEASATITFDRSKFDVRYGSETFFGSLGDKAIYNDVKMEVKLKAAK